MNKGIVMEKGDSFIVVMSPEGRFDKLPRGTRNCEVGEEILYTVPAKAGFKAPKLTIASGLAAAVVLVFVMISTLTGQPASGQVVAYVSIDINPSVELGIDDNEIVQDLQGLNTDGTTLIQSLDYKGKSVQDVTAAILDKAEQGPLSTGEGDIIISSTLVADKSDIDDEALAAKLKEQVNKHIEEAHPEEVKNYEVTAFAAPQEVRQEAKASGVSAGKYAIYLNAVNSGVDVSLDDIKSVSVHQLAKDNGGIGNLIKSDQPISKKSLKQLLDDEKSGKLSEKLQQATKNNADKAAKDNGKGGKTTKGPSPSPTATPKNGKTDNRGGKNGTDDKNANDDRNSRDNNNGKNDKDDKNDKNDKTGKNDNNDKNDKSNNGKNDGKTTGDGKNGKTTSLPSLSPKPSIQPGKPGDGVKLTPSPSPKAGAGGKGGDKSDDGKGKDAVKDGKDSVKEAKDSAKDAVKDAKDKLKNGLEDNRGSDSKTEGKSTKQSNTHSSSSGAGRSSENWLKQLFGKLRA